MKLMIYFCEKHLNKYFKELNKEFDTFKLEQTTTKCNEYSCFELGYNVVIIKVGYK